MRLNWNITQHDEHGFVHATLRDDRNAAVLLRAQDHTTLLNLCAKWEDKAFRALVAHIRADEGLRKLADECATMDDAHKATAAFCYLVGQHHYASRVFMVDACPLSLVQFPEIVHAALAHWGAQFVAWGGSPALGCAYPMGVDADTLVAVRKRDGTTACADARMFDWSAGDGPSTILYYRIV